ncbi:hypothetical protein AB0O91_01310 [Kitasatospora sp. NPDC089797]|uniref:hypothetical protein n=1 Tax=Kitasatospora sp. NPDC089797 TaxID=3155298 RepID=UPI0034411CE9
MDTIAVLQMDTPTNIRLLRSDHTPADPETPVHRVHQAPVGPSGSCGPLTFCGLDTADMTIAPQAPGSGPPRWHACSNCQSAAAAGSPSPGALQQLDPPPAPASDAPD